MLAIRGLRKVYEDGTIGVDGLDLSVEAGEIFVLLGANGAGKTSTIMMIFGFTEPTDGTITINGVDVQKNPLEAKRHAAYVSENVMLYGNFTARQNLSFFCELGGRRNVKDAELRDAIRRVGLAERALYRRVRGFSKGMRQRLGIAIAMLKNADLIVLDEPTSGLDPKGGAEFLDILRELRSEGKAILMSSHDVFRARTVADRVGIMRRGKLIKLIDRDRLREEDLEELYLASMEEEVAGATSAEVQVPC
jgi:ABC-2 type transport system ATP-binding protein